MGHHECHLDGQDVVFHTDNSGVLQALRNEENRCLCADHIGVDWWTEWQQLQTSEDNVTNVRVKWVKPHTTQKQRMIMTDNKNITAGVDLTDSSPYALCVVPQLFFITAPSRGEERTWSAAKK